eukprot:c10381_g1_i1.p1 GENE.c10381_g1_i1~~c10381_g1_i1.p1  ORF type:complete len:433 (+),score=99.98 c10381_g1_i1:28-1326(+)
MASTNPTKPSLIANLSNFAFSVKNVSAAMDTARKKFVGVEESKIHSPEFITQKRVLKQTRSFSERLIEASRAASKSGTKFVEDCTRLLGVLNEVVASKEVQDVLDEQIVSVLMTTQTNIVNTLPAIVAAMSFCFDENLQPSIAAMQKAREDKNKCYSLAKECETAAVRVQQQQLNSNAYTQLLNAQEDYRQAAFRYGKQERVSVGRMADSQSQFLFALSDSCQHLVDVENLQMTQLSQNLALATGAASALKEMARVRAQEAEKERDVRRLKDNEFLSIARERDGMCSLMDLLTSRYRGLGDAPIGDLARRTGEGVVLRVDHTMWLTDAANVFGVLVCSNYRLCHCPYVSASDVQDPRLVESDWSRGLKDLTKSPLLQPETNHTWRLGAPLFEIPLSSVSRMENFGGERELLVVWTHSGACFKSPPSRLAQRT